MSLLQIGGKGTVTCNLKQNLSAIWRSDAPVLRLVTDTHLEYEIVLANSRGKRCRKEQQKKSVAMEREASSNANEK